MADPERADQLRERRLLQRIQSQNTARVLRLCGPAELRERVLRLDRDRGP